MAVTMPSSVVSHGRDCGEASREYHVHPRAFGPHYGDEKIWWGCLNHATCLGAPLAAIFSLPSSALLVVAGAPALMCRDGWGVSPSSLLVEVLFTYGGVAELIFLRTGPTRSGLSISAGGDEVETRLAMKTKLTSVLADDGDIYAS